MATKRQPALSTQLKAAQAEVEALKKKLADSEKQKEGYYKSFCDASAELSAIHDVLDALPEAPRKRIEETYSERRVNTRLAAYFAAIANRRAG